MEEKEQIPAEERKTSAYDESQAPSIQEPERNDIRERPDYEGKILKLIQSTSSPKVLRDSLEHYHVSDIADTLSQLSDAERSKFFKMLDTQLLAQVLEYLDVEDQALYLSEMNIKKVISILNEMEPDKAADILKKMDRSRREIILELLDSDIRKDISLIISYDEDLIGSKMTTNFIEIKQGATVKEAMKQLMHQAKENDNISMIYVIDDAGMYYGAIHIKDLFVARANTDLEDIIETNFPFVYGSEPIDNVMEDLRDYNEDSIPVLSNDNQVLGVITSQDLLELFDQERGEDYVKFAGVSAEEDLEETLFKSMTKRLPWLLILLVLALGVSTVVSLFESVVAQLTIIMVFQSLILDMAGNVGTQTLAVSIRVLTDSALDWKQRLFLIGKEARVGFVNGLILGGGSCLVLGIFIRFTTPYDWFASYAISACIGLAMMTSMVISSLTGTTIPLLFKSVGIDPAVASGPLITTLNDLIGVVTYYSLCWLLLIQGLGL